MKAVKAKAAQGKKERKRVADLRKAAVRDNCFFFGACPRHPDTSALSVVKGSTLAKRRPDNLPVHLSSSVLLASSIVPSLPI
jgi:hypothetical protein